MNRLGCSVLALVSAAVLGITTIWALPRERAGTTAADLDPLYASELERIAAAGLAVLEQGQVETPVFQQVVPLRAGECVALLVGTIGPGELSDSAIELEGRTSERGNGGGGRLAHTAVCTASATTATVTFHVTTDAADYGSTWARYTLATGPIPSDPSSYGRLSLSMPLQELLQEREVRARGRALASAEGGGEALHARDIAPGVALLLPVSRSTYAASRVLAGSGPAVPSLDLAPGDLADPFATARDQREPARMYAAAGRLRLLLVLDAGALGAGCLRVAFTRLDDPATAVPITRVALPSLAEVELASPDPAVGIDMLCPADGLFAYGVPENLAGTYQLEVAQTGDPATPGHPTALTATPLALPLVSALSARCSALEDQACIELAGLAAARVHGAGEVRPILEPVCERSGGQACALLASFLEESDARSASRFERQACATSDLPSCLRHAARLRAEGRLGDALSTYRFACAHGEPSACRSVALFAEWELAPAVDVPRADALP